MNRTASVRGALAELALERRLLELGYSQILRPARMDHAVDFCVWTSKGWLGIQVKTVVRAKRDPRHTHRRMLLDLRYEGRGKGYYAANGVHVFAAWAGAGFYVVPIAEIPGKLAMKLDRRPWLWEAWTRALGEPASLIHASPVTEVEEARQGVLFVG